MSIPTKIALERFKKLLAELDEAKKLPPGKERDNKIALIKIELNSNY